MKTSELDIELFKLNDGDKVLAGISGGPDSMALLDMLRRLREEINFSLSVAHINHGLRKEALDEEEGIRKYCKKYEIPFFCHRIDLLSKQKGLSLEEAARQERYSFFEKLIQEYDFNKLMTAHHLNDQAETVLMRLLRGTGPQGACGINNETERFGAKIIRPFLTKTKVDLRQYCEDNQIPYFEDLSNYENDYSRNFLRNSIFPDLEKRFPHSQESLARFAELMQKQQNFLESILENLGEKWLIKEFWGVKILKDLFLKPEELFQKENLSFLSKQDYDYLIDEMIRLAIVKVGDIKDVSLKHIYSIREFFKSQSPGELSLPNGLIAIQTSGEFYITTQDQLPESFDNYFLGKINKEKSFIFPKENLILQVKIGKACDFENHKKSTFKALIKQNSLEGPLEFRHRLSGDKVFLSGMKHPKKLSRYMIDKKIPKFLRDTLPVLAIENTVIWIPGLYIHKDYMVSSSQDQVAEFSISKYN